MMIRVIVCCVLLSAPSPFGPRAAAPASTFVSSAPSAIIEVKTDRLNCWHRCRHLCRGRPKSACSFCMRKCKAKSARSLVAISFAPHFMGATVPERAPPATQDEGPRHSRGVGVLSTLGYRQISTGTELNVSTRVAWLPSSKRARPRRP